MKKWFLFFTIFFFGCVSAQTFDWWKNNVNWDGTTNWWKYLITSPKFFGPNAFTVPAINNGSADSIIYLATTANLHFSKGDNTQNIMLYGNLTTKKNTISVDAQFVPYERFTMSHEKKTERKVYYQNYNDKHTVGDVMVNTTIQLFEKWRNNFQLAMRVGIRMPSGGGQGAARYADVPSYWIDLGGALPLKNPEWKWLNMVGFFVWQTNDDDLRQDDAFLFGSGVEWNHHNFRLQGYGAGYVGYKDNGDKPVVFRVNFEKRRKSLVYIFRFQQGLHDFEYSSFEMGAKLIWEK